MAAGDINTALQNHVAFSYNVAHAAQCTAQQSPDKAYPRALVPYKSIQSGCVNVSSFIHKRPKPEVATFVKVEEAFTFSSANRTLLCP